MAEESTDPAGDNDPPRPKAVRKVRPPRKPGPLGTRVASVVGELQARYLKNESIAIAELAQLRQAVNAEPGTSRMDSVWLPDELLEADAWRYDRGDEAKATPSERALHTAVTLFAVHQQSQREQPMHVPGTTFGAAAQWLAAVKGDTGAAASADNPVYKRFTALGTAATYEELVYHARHLIKQLRGEKIGFDYGVFADDLRTFQLKGPFPSGQSGADHVRALWGRDYWRARPSQKKPAEADSTGTTDPSNDQE